MALHQPWRFCAAVHHRSGCLVGHSLKNWGVVLTGIRAASDLEIHRVEKSKLSKEAVALLHREKWVEDFR